MVFAIRVVLSAMLILSFATPGRAVQSENDEAAVSHETLQQYVAELTKNPADIALRERIIMLALIMDPAPIVPEDAARNMARGAALIRTAAGAGEYKLAIVEFESAVKIAPWLAMAYFNLATVQEKVGLYNEAIQNLKLYLMASPDAKNGENVRNKIAELEADLEGLKSGKNAAKPVSPEAGTTPEAALAVTGSADSANEPEEQQTILKLQPSAKKIKARSFIGNWYFKDTVRGEERTIQAFRITRDANGDIVPIAPERSSDYVPTIRSFDIVGNTLIMEIHWRLSSAVGYWKIERYTLTLSGDRTKLTGSYLGKSVGGRNIHLERTLFRR